MSQSERKQANKADECCKPICSWWLQAGVENGIGCAEGKPGLLWPLSQLALNLDL